jgi:cell wall-associated NlpC family hydrolase
MRRLRTAAALAPLAFALACATTPRAVAARPAPTSEPAGVRAARAALSVLGTPYRYGGRTPRGFDCSGLVLYSFAEAGLTGLPHSAKALERRARPVALDALRPGDLLFFDLDGRKTAHVAIYAGDATFVHAPSSGKRVERVELEHVYWGARLERAGRLGR